MSLRKLHDQQKNLYLFSKTGQDFFAEPIIFFSENQNILHGPFIKRVYNGVSLGEIILQNTGTNSGGGGGVGWTYFEQTQQVGLSQQYIKEALSG